MESTLLPRDCIDQRQERTASSVLYSIQESYPLHYQHLWDSSFLCSTVSLILFIASKYLYTDGKFSEGGSLDLAPQPNTECASSGLNEWMNMSVTQLFIFFRVALTFSYVTVLYKSSLSKNEQVSMFQFSRSVVSDSATQWTVALQVSLSISNQSLLTLMSIKSVMPSNHLILCRPLLLPSSIFTSIKVFSSESVLCIKWPKYWSVSMSPSNEYLGMISLRIDWFDLLAVQGTLKSLPQNYSSKASILQCSAFFMVQLSHPHVTTGKTIALTRGTFVGKVLSLLFNTLCWFVIAFLPRSKCLLISWL